MVFERWSLAGKIAPNTNMQGMLQEPPVRKKSTSDKDADDAAQFTSSRREVRFLPDMTVSVLLDRRPIFTGSHT